MWADGCASCTPMRRVHRCCLATYRNPPNANHASSTCCIPTGTHMIPTCCSHCSNDLCACIVCAEQDHVACAALVCEVLHPDALGAPLGQALHANFALVAQNTPGKCHFEEFLGESFVEFSSHPPSSIYTAIDRSFHALL